MQPPPIGHTSAFVLRERLSTKFKNVPCRSSEHDTAWRILIKDQFNSLGAGRNKDLLFLLRDGYVIGCSGKDLSKDEGFESGLPCWRSLEALQFEGRRVVPGPLPPPSSKYECEILGSSLKKVFANMRPGPDKPTKAQLRKLQELLASGEAALNADRADRLRATRFIDEQDDAMSALLEEVMKDERIATRVNEAVERKAAACLEQNVRVRAETARLEKLYADAVEKQKKLEKEQKRLAPAVAKAIRASFDKARGDAVGT